MGDTCGNTASLEACRKAQGLPPGYVSATTAACDKANGIGGNAQMGGEVFYFEIEGTGVDDGQIISLPNITGGQSIFIHDLSNVQVIDLSGVVSLGNVLRIYSNPSLTFVNLEKLESTSLTIKDNASLENLSLPSYVGSAGSITWDLRNNAFPAETVNDLLVYAAAQGFTAGSINLSGAGNAAPTGQGLTAKAQLISDGVTVTTN